MVAVERVFFQVNVKTAMSVGQASGLALVAAAEAGCEVAQYTSNEVKQALVGYGAATKDQVQRMVASVLGLADAAEPARRGRRPGPGRLPPDHRPVAPSRGAPPHSEAPSRRSDRDRIVAGNRRAAIGRGRGDRRCGRGRATG